MTVAEQLVDWAWSLRLEDIPSAAREAAARHLLDGIGTALGARRLGAGVPAVEVALALGGPPEATVIGQAQRVGAPAAALANGALVHALDFDDTHAGGLVHATAATLPAALAVGEQVDATGSQLLAAAIAGYEVVTRLGQAAPHGFHARGFHATSVCGVFAAALISARLQGLPPQQGVAALGIAGSQASGSLEFLATGSSTKQLHPGWSSMSGVIAARLAAAGATGPASILEGDAGLYRLYTGAQVDPATVTAGLGSRWEVERITVKPYPICQLSHATLDALASADVAPADVVSIEVQLPAEAMPIVAEPRSTKVRPRSAYEAKFSLPWCAALLLLDGAVDVDGFSPANLARPDISELASRIAVVAVPFDGAPANAPGVARISLVDGRVEHARVGCSRGGPQTPLTRDELLAKFRANAGGVAGHMADELADAILDLEQLASARRLGQLLAATAARPVEVP